MDRRNLLALVAGAALAGTAGVASAVPFTITGGSATPTGISVGSTVDVQVSDTLAHSFDLEVGETTERFDFLDVSVTGLGLVTGYIDAEMGFSEPTEATATRFLTTISSSDWDRSRTSSVFPGSRRGLSP